VTATSCEKAAAKKTPSSVKKRGWESAAWLTAETSAAKVRC
jgi:hypothetical protein